MSDLNLPPDIQEQLLKAALDQSHYRDGDIVKGGAPGFEPTGDHDMPKSFFSDPYQFMDHLGIGFRESPNELSYGTLKAMSERNPIVAAVHQTRLDQVSSFCKRPDDKYSIGFRILPKNKEKKLTESERSYLYELEEMVLRCGIDRNRERPNMRKFIRKALYDSLRYDQMCVEVVPRYNKLPHHWLPVDSATIRMARNKNYKGLPAYTHKDYKKPIYVQLLQGRVVTQYDPDRLAFCVRNPRSDIYVGSYGFSELERLILQVTSQLWAEEWNRNFFKQGSTTKGVFLVKGQVPTSQLDSFRRMWMQQVSSYANAWKTPIINSEGAEWINMQPNNMEMGYQQWLEYLIKIICSMYQIDPAEINFDLRGAITGQQPMFMTTNEAQQKMSKDRGLRPLLTFLKEFYDDFIISPIDDSLEFKWVGLDQKNEEQNAQLRMQELQNFKTINEVREEEGLPPVEGGDIIPNPVYTANLQQKQMMEQAAEGEGAEAPAPAEGQEERQAQMPFEEEEQDAGERLAAIAEGDAEAFNRGAYQTDALWHKSTTTEPRKKDDFLDISSLQKAIGALEDG